MTKSKLERHGAENLTLHQPKTSTSIHTINAALKFIREKY
ncbi:hypothetical protein DSUL_30095 [Desulfovibrionales bacterium]